MTSTHARQKRRSIPSARHGHAPHREMKRAGITKQASKWQYITADKGYHAHSTAKQTSHHEYNTETKIKAWPYSLRHHRRRASLASRARNGIAAITWFTFMSFIIYFDHRYIIGAVVGRNYRAFSATTAQRMGSYRA